MLDRTRQAVFRFNVAQRGDALELLRSLPDRNASVALFNPQHRSVLDHLKFGNDLGIDPDLSGTLAIVETINGVPALIDAVDMPSTGHRSEGSRRHHRCSAVDCKARAVNSLYRARTGFPRTGRIVWIPLRSGRRRHRGHNRALSDSHDLGRGFGLEAPAPSSRQR